LLRVKLDGAGKVAASLFAAENDVAPGARLGIAAPAPARQPEPA
jgi:hypothetical protein